MLVIALLDACPQVQAPPRDVVLSPPIVARLEVVSAIEGELPHILAHGIAPRTAAGAIADGQTLARKPGARSYLEQNDSYHYFEPLGDLVITGPTNTNVMDVRLILVGSRK